MDKWSIPDYTVIFQDNHKIKNLPNPFPVVLLYVLKVIIFLNGKNETECQKLYTFSFQ